jgi:hypothetical protein
MTQVTGSGGELLFLPRRETGTKSRFTTGATPLVAHSPFHVTLFIPKNDELVVFAYSKNY